MALKATCTVCKKEIIDPLQDVVEYHCGHLEHVDCYYDHHPHNRICVECGCMSFVLLFS